MNELLNICPVCKEPYLVFDISQKGIIAEMGGGPHPTGCGCAYGGQTTVYQWNKDRFGNVQSTNPLDRFNDATKATTYLFANQTGYANVRAERKSIKVVSLSEAMGL